MVSVPTNDLRVLFSKDVPNMTLKNIFFRIVGGFQLAHHALPARVNASDSSSAEQPNTFKKPARKLRAEMEESSEHCPLGGNSHDDDEDEGPSGGIDESDEDGNGIPKDLQVRKRPATRGAAASKKKPSTKRGRKQEADREKKKQ